MMAENHDQNVLLASVLLDEMIKKMYVDLGQDEKRPIDEAECYMDDGTLDLNMLDTFIEREDEEKSVKRDVLALTTYLLCKMREKEDEEARTATSKGCSQNKKLKRTTTRLRNVKVFQDPTTGELRQMTPTLSLWWVLYIQEPKPECSQWSKTFKNRFRLPYNSFLDLLRMVLDEDPTDGLFH
jgi:hypothetical protein